MRLEKHCAMAMRYSMRIFDEVLREAVSNVKRNTMLSEQNYQVEKQVQAWWRRLRTASGKRVWHVAGC